MEESQENGGNIISVRTIEPIFIQPETKICNETYFLSNLDHAVISTVKTVYIYKLDGKKSGEEACDLIKQALAKVLVHYYPLAGRLRRSSTGNLFVECNIDSIKGVPFVEAVADCDIQKLGDITVPDTAMLEKLVYDVPGVKNILEMPLMTAQVTRFKCGGFVLGMAMNHCMADGKSVMEFVNSWAETARGVTLTLLPVLDRSTFMISKKPSLDKNDSQKFTISDISNLETLFQEQKMIYKSFKFDPSKLAGLKKLAMENGAPSQCSSFTVLAALLWRARSQALKMKPQQRTKLVFTVDIRSKLKSPLPKGYFGNGVLVTECLCTAGELIEKPFSFVVKMVRSAIERVNEDYIREYIECFDLNARPSFTATLVITSWTRIAFNAADFGWGEPTQFGSIGIPKEVALFIPNGKDNNGIVLVLGLPASAMDTFQELVTSF